MRLFLSYCIIQYALLLINFHVTSSQQPTLKLINVIYRHGDRSPLMTFPKDQWIDHWEDGLNQLTKLGKQQHFALGQYFRQRYGNLLNTTYRHEDILVQSTDVDRTLQSAYCNLAGLYPPTGDQIWNQQILWQPIPVHIVPPGLLKRFLMWDRVPCPKLDKLNKIIEELPEMKSATERLENLSPFISNETGAVLNNATAIEDLHDFFHVLQMHNLSVPDWTDHLMKEIELFEGIRNNLTKNYPEVFKLSGGPLLHEMITNMENKILGNITQKMFVYSGHETSISSLLQALQIYNDIDPAYCTTLMLELYENDKKEDFVQIFYRNSTTAPPVELALPNCARLCPFQKFKELTAAMVVWDLNKECISES